MALTYKNKWDRSIESNPKFQDEAWELEFLWINTGKIEGLDSAFAEQRQDEYKQYQFYKKKEGWSHVVKVTCRHISSTNFIAMQRVASQIGVLGTEIVGLPNVDGTINVYFTFCMNSLKSNKALECEIIEYFCLNIQDSIQLNVLVESPKQPDSTLTTNTTIS